MNVITGNKLPIKSWCGSLEDSALAQANNLANLPFAFKHVALMPDCHAGYGCPIGSVLATKNVVVPNSVGVDIFCSMSAQATTTAKKDMTPEKTKELLSQIKKVLPFGNGNYSPVDLEISKIFDELDSSL